MCACTHSQQLGGGASLGAHLQRVAGFYLCAHTLCQTFCVLRAIQRVAVRPVVATPADVRQQLPCVEQLSQGTL